MLCADDQRERAMQLYSADIMWTIANGFLQGYSARPPSEMFLDIRDKTNDARSADDIKSSILSRLER